MHVPRYLRDRNGQPLKLPKKAVAVLCCPTCGARLVRAQHYYVCPDGLHSRAWPDGALLAEVLRVLEFRLPRDCWEKPATIRSIVRNLFRLLPPPFRRRSSCQSPTITASL